MMVRRGDHKAEFFDVKIKRGDSMQTGKWP